MELSLFSQYPITCTIFYVQLGPGPGGPRMDRRAVTSLGVVKISRLALRLRRSAQSGPDPIACQKVAVKNCYSQPAKSVRLKTVTHSLPRVCG